MNYESTSCAQTADSILVVEDNAVTAESRGSVVKAARL